MILPVKGIPLKCFGGGEKVLVMGGGEMGRYQLLLRLFYLVSLLREFGTLPKCLYKNKLGQRFSSFDWHLIFSLRGQPCVGYRLVSTFAVNHRERAGSGKIESALDLARDDRNEWPDVTEGKRGSKLSFLKMFGLPFHLN